MKATRALKEERKSVQAAIAKAEEGTAAEIVCALSTESGRYDRAEALAGLTFAIIGLGVAHVMYDFAGGEAGDWTLRALSLGWQVLAVVLGFVVGQLAASFVHAIRGLFVSEREMSEEVRRAAWHVFGAASLRGTVGKNGVLVYVSLFERRVVVLADEAGLDALGTETIEAMRDAALEQLRAKEVAKAFTGAVALAGPRLAKVLPARRDGNPNELEDHVLVFHPRPDLA